MGKYNRFMGNQGSSVNRMQIPTWEGYCHASAHPAFAFLTPRSMNTDEIDFQLKHLQRLGEARAESKEKIRRENPSLLPSEMDGVTEIHEAIQHNMSDFFRLLPSMSSAQLRWREDESGRTLLMRAFEKIGDTVALAVINKMAPEDFAMQNMRGNTALMIAIEFDLKREIEAILAKTPAEQLQIQNCHKESVASRAEHSQRTWAQAVRKLAQ